MRVILALMFLTSCAHADHKLKVFDSTLSITSMCQLESEVNGIVTKYDFGFDKPKDCRIVTHPNTSSESIKFINGGYIAFIENNHVDQPRCYSEYTAIKVDSKNNIVVSPLVKRSGSCFQGKEMKDFQYFSNKFEH